MGVVQSVLAEVKTVNSQTATFTLQNVTAGNSIVVLIYMHNSSATISSVADNNSGSYSALSTIDTDTNDPNQRFVGYIAQGITGGTKPTITVHFSASITGGYICILECSGLATSPFDKKAISASASTNTFTSGTTATTTAANELILGWWGTLSLLAAVTFTAASSYTLGPTLNDSGFGTAGAVVYKTVTATGTQQAGVNSSGSAMSAWGMDVYTLAMLGSIAGNAGVAGATVSWSGTASGSTTADGSGNYTIPNLANGSYTVTPSLASYVFSPTSANETVSNNSITGVNFTATQQFTVSGNCGVNGATITYSGTASGSTTANSSGDFTISNVPPGTLNITPSKTGSLFSPTSQSPSIAANTVVIFTGYPSTIPFTLTQLATESFVPNANPLNPANWETPAVDHSLKALNSKCQATLTGADDSVEVWIGSPALPKNTYCQFKLVDWVKGNGQDIIMLVETDTNAALTGLFLTLTDNGDGTTTTLQLYDANEAGLPLVYGNNSAIVNAGDVFIFGAAVGPSGNNVGFVLQNGVLLGYGEWSGGTGTLGIETDPQVTLLDSTFSFLAFGSATTTVPPPGSGGMTSSYGFQFRF